MTSKGSSMAVDAATSLSSSSSSSSSPTASQTSNNKNKENHSNGLHPVDVQKNGKNEKSKQKKRKRKKNKHRNQEKQEGEAPTQDLGDDIEVEFVTKDPLEDISSSDLPEYEEFRRILGIFSAPLQQEEAAEGEEHGEGETEQQGSGQGQPRSGGSAASGRSGGGGDEDEDDDEEDAENQPGISKKQKKKQKRLSVAVLKQLVPRPDLVEVWDPTSADPGLLVYLKAYRNSVTVPKHWNQKRKYLQGKRGIEKPPFQLPDFIAATGISKIRQAVQEKEDAKKLKAKQRERMAPKLGKLDIDYQVLHDAFFKYQTKPKLTVHGDLYSEGKEFEIQLKEKRPGVVSEDLKRALGMPEGAPPPWLINMQRYGPPPSYPNLKIPGVNAPIPEGARYGFHPGGWGKPPVDELGRPLYGDVFGTAPPEPPPEISQPIERKHWGEIEDDEDVDADDDDDDNNNTNNNNEDDAAAEDQGDQKSLDGVEGKTPNDQDNPHPSGFETPSGLTTPSGLETPESLDLRKGQTTSSSSSSKISSSSSSSSRDGTEDNKELFQVLPVQQTSVGGALVGSTHKYVMPGTAATITEKKVEPKLSNKVDLIKNQRGEKIDIALNPSEVENIDELNMDVLKKKYEQAVADKSGPTEDVSDIIAEHSKKKRKKEGRDKEKDKDKKYKDFKF